MTRSARGSMSMSLGRIRDLLTERRARLADELERLASPPDETATVSFGKRVGEGTTEAVERMATTAAAKSIACSIAGIDRALDKLDAGTYGQCDGCGEAIGDSRLEVRPAATLCVVCAS